MPVTHILKNLTGDHWRLTMPAAELVDDLIAPDAAEAALAVEHLVPRDGGWQGRSHRHFTYQAPSRIDVSRRSHRY